MRTLPLATMLLAGCSLQTLFDPELTVDIGSDGAGTIEALIFAAWG